MTGATLNNLAYISRIAFIVALGGFLMGFDSSVISGVVGFVETEFELSRIELGWAVASLTLTATVAMMLAGPLSDRIGRRPVLMLAALTFAISALASAVAPDYLTLVLARMLGGFGVGAALIVAPMYIAEIAPPELRGRLVSFNQLNIVIGISVAFFSNYLILQAGQWSVPWVTDWRLDEWGWRWMLGIETLPALLYLLALLAVPESPRWLAMRGQSERALQIMTRVVGSARAQQDIDAVRGSMEADSESARPPFVTLFRPAMRLVLTIGVVVAVLQQITGINSVFFYAPMIFEQSGIGTDASFMQAVLVGIVNLAFTVAAILLIDKLGRRPLLIVGLTTIAACMLLLAYGFGTATYTLTSEGIASLSGVLDSASLAPLAGITHTSDVAFRAALDAAIGAGPLQVNEGTLISAAIQINPVIILVGILGFVAGFAISLGPVMWVLFSELFPNRIRGLAVSFVGLINSGVSFVVQLVFPWELQNLGNAATFLIYGMFAIVGLIVVVRIFPETKGRSLEDLEAELIRR